VSSGSDAQQGRLSQSYGQEVLKLTSPSPPPPPAEGDHGRLAADYASAVLPTQAGQFQTVFEERFDGRQTGWPADSIGAVRRVASGWQLTTRSDGSFVAIGAPIPTPLHDVVVAATFAKIGGAPGGAFGLFVRDDGRAPRDGRSQVGRFYVAAVG